MRVRGGGGSGDGGQKSTSYTPRVRGCARACARVRVPSCAQKTFWPNPMCYGTISQCYQLFIEQLDHTFVSKCIRYGLLQPILRGLTGHRGSGFHLVSTERIDALQLAQ